MFVYIYEEVAHSLPKTKSTVADTAVIGTFSTVGLVCVGLQLDS